MIKDIIESNKNVNHVEEKIKRLKEIFPGAFHREEIDLEYIKNQIKDTKTIKEGYELKFLGKSYAKLLVALDTETVIVPDNEHNHKEENIKSENLYITADNLDALKHLSKSYWKKAKLIYIDPPYNTGKDDFVYKDTFGFSKNDLILKLGLDESEAERLVEMTSTGSSSHSAWLTFLYPRLYIARNLMSDDAVIFISIDDNEMNNLKFICNDIFGEENFVACLPTVMNLKGNNDEYAFAGTHEYTLVYCRNKEIAVFNEYPIDDDSIEDWEVDERGYFKKGANLKSTGVNAPRAKRPNLFFPIYVNVDGEFSLKKRNGWFECLPITDGKEMSWRWSKSKFTLEKDDVIVNFAKENTTFYKKQRPSLGELPSKKPKSLFYKPEYSSGNGTQEIKSLFGMKVFSNPKPLNLLKDLLMLGTNRDSLIIDFFSGSATTAHATMELNAEDGGNRKFILIQLPENLDDALVRKPNDQIILNQIKICDDVNQKHTLDIIGMERIKRSNKLIKSSLLNKIEEAGLITDGILNPESIDFGFKHFIVKPIENNQLMKLDEFNSEILFTDNGILDEFGIDTILTTWKNMDGYGLTKEWKELKLDNYTTYQIGGTIYLLNPELTEKAVKALMEKYDLDDFNCNKIVIFGYSFTMTEIQSLKDNLKQVEGVKHITLDIIVRY